MIMPADGKDLEQRGYSCIYDKNAKLTFILENDWKFIVKLIIHLLTIYIYPKVPLLTIYHKEMKMCVYTQKNYRQGAPG